MAGAVKKVVPWVRCQMCEDYLCNVCEPVGTIHAHDCECPEIDVWCDYELFPYEECDLARVQQMIAEQRAIADHG